MDFSYMCNRISQRLLSSAPTLERTWTPVGSVHYRSKMSLISCLVVYCFIDKVWLSASIPAATCRNSGATASHIRFLKAFWLTLFCPTTGCITICCFFSSLLAFDFLFSSVWLFFAFFKKGSLCLSCITWPWSVPDCAYRFRNSMWKTTQDMPKKWSHGVFMMFS